MTINDVKRSLPNVGDRRKGGIVVQVNRNHLWYRVKKDICGISIFECYRLPDACALTSRSLQNEQNAESKRYLKSVKCLNTGKIFNRCADAAKEYGLATWAVRKAARTGVRVGDTNYLFEYLPRKAGEEIA